MARARSKKAENTEFFEALDMLCQEKGIPTSYLIDKITAAIIIAVKRDYGGDENIYVIMDSEKNIFSVAIRKHIVEEVENSEEEITLENARRHKKTAMLDEFIDIQLETKQFGRIAAQTAKHVIRQGIREAERGQQLEEFQRRHQELVTALILRIDPRSGAAILEIGKSEAVLPLSEQIAGETLKEGERIKVFVVDVKETDRGPRVLISRTHPGLVKRLFEMEIPEIFDGVVEIKAASREAGSRTKIAVYSHDKDVDAVGACIGNRSERVATIVDELDGEKIDIIEYSKDPAEFIAASLAPAAVVKVELAEDGSKGCQVFVPDDQLSLAIGNKGQNARLAAKLTSWKIDIRPESELASRPDFSTEETEIADIEEDVALSDETLDDEILDTEEK